MDALKLDVRSAKPAADTIPAAQSMTLRDWFAGQALVGLYSGRFEGRFDLKLIHEDARVAYSVADAMLAARSGQ